MLLHARRSRYDFARRENAQAAAVDQGEVPRSQMVPGPRWLFCHRFTIVLLSAERFGMAAPPCLALPRPARPATPNLSVVASKEGPKRSHMILFQMVRVPNLLGRNWFFSQIV